MLTADAIKELANLATMKDGDTINTPDGGVAVVLPQGFTLAKVPPLEAPLTHIKQGVTLHDQQSFIDYVNAYKGPLTRVFAEPGFLATEGKARFGAALDYHAAPSETHNFATAQRLGHRAAYAPRYSEAWERWTKACSEPMRQMEFAEFIEECRGDIIDPSAAQMLDIVRTFKASKKVDFDSLTYQPNGAVKLHYSEEVEKHGASASLPEVMRIGIPVYYRGTPFEIGVFIRFRVVSAAVVFNLKIDRADRIEDAAFEGLATEVRDATNLPVHIGRI